MGARRADATACVAGYLIGSVPVGLMVGRSLRGLDVRDYGSGNIGTTNVLRIVGPSAAALTFGLDVAKGSVAVLVARRLGADAAGQAGAGVAAAVGHSWPMFARFRGGKGVATAFGGLLVVSPQASGFAVVGGLSSLALSRTVSVGSLAAAASATLGATIESIRTGRAAPFVFTALVTSLVAARHGPNLRRLARGEEPRVSLRMSAGS